MKTIEIDFDVYKELVARRKTESVTYNDVLRDLLKLGPATSSNLSEPSPVSGTWTTKGVSFPPGTEFRTKYKGKAILGRIENGALVVEGKRYDSPSSAAVAITKNPVNGWIFWECKLPGNTSWQIIKSLRK